MSPGVDSAIAVLAGAVAAAIGLWANFTWGPSAKESRDERHRDSGNRRRIDRRLHDKQDDN